MKARREEAYRFLLAAGLLHVKWDLACWSQGFAWLNPKLAIYQLKAARRASHRSYAFHNLAIHSSCGFEGFSEDQFWQGITQFDRAYPNDAFGNYPSMFERALRDEEVHVIRPGG